MKEITFGIPNGGSLGDLITLNPLMKQNKNSTIQFAPTLRSLQLAELFLGICKIQIVDEKDLIYDVEAIKNHGYKERANPYEHASINFLNIFDCKTDDILPKINLYDFDIKFAKEILVKYKKPICINMLCGNYKDNNDLQTQYRMLPFDFWQQIINILIDKNYDVLHFGLKDDVIQGLTGVNYINGLSFRQTAACINYVKNIITVDSGLHHLSTASGANVYCLHPPDNLSYSTKNYHYDNRFWKLENRRVFYDCFNSNFTNLKYLINSL